MKYPHLFSPITIRSMTLRNRIVMTAMHLGYTPTGEVTERLIEFYRARAKGGAGLIVVGGCPIDEYAGMPNMIGLFDDRFVPGLKQLTGAVKAEGAKIAAQLYQAGRYTHSALIGGRKPISASAVRSRLTGETPRALEIDEIPQVQESFGFRRPPCKRGRLRLSGDPGERRLSDQPVLLPCHQQEGGPLRRPAREPDALRT